MRNLGGRAQEIIVVDNNSSDGTKQVVERYPGVTYVFEPARASPAPGNAAIAPPAATSSLISTPTPSRSRGWIEQIWEQFARHPDLACLSGPYSFYDLSSIRNKMTSGWFVARATAL